MNIVLIAVAVVVALLVTSSFAKSDIFRSASQRFGIRESLLKAIADVESSFNPRALGKSGEVGMFQMKRSAFLDAKKKYGLPGEWPSALYDPALSALYAAAYLRWIESQGVVGDIEVLRAYNQGVEGAKRNKNAGLAYARLVLEKEKLYA